MGSYTPNFGLYKPDPSEIVDVDGHLNYNWNILDEEAKRLMEYRYTNVSSVNNQFTDKRPMHRFYKTWSNSLVFEDYDSTLEQDTVARVYSWTSAKSLLGADWSIRSGNGLYYRLITRADLGTSTVEWTGSVEYQGGAVIPAYTQFANVLTLPSDITPKMSRYFQRSAGTCATEYSAARFIFNRLGHVDIIRYGTSPVANQNKLDFGTIKYDVNLVGS